MLRVSRLPRGLPLRDEDERGAQRVDGCLPQQLIGVGDAAEDHPEEVAHVLRDEGKFTAVLQKKISSLQLFAARWQHWQLLTSFTR